MDIKTGIHEPTVTLPIGMDCRTKGQLDLWKCTWVKTEVRRKTANLKSDMTEHLFKDADNAE